MAAEAAGICGPMSSSRHALVQAAPMGILPLEEPRAIDHLLRQFWTA